MRGRSTMRALSQQAPFQKEERLFRQPPARRLPLRLDDRHAPPDLLDARQRRLQLVVDDARGYGPVVLDLVERVGGASSPICIRLNTQASTRISSFWKSSKSVQHPQ